MTILKCQQRQKNKIKNGELIFCKLFRIIQFFFLILLREATLESKVAPTKRNSSALHCYTLLRPFTTLSCFPFFYKLFLELIFATKIKTMLLKQSAVLFTFTNVELFSIFHKLFLELIFATKVKIKLLK